MCMSYRVVKSVDVTTRKRHMCEWCAITIDAGQPAHYRSYVFDGEFNYGHMHPECHAAMLESDIEYVCEGWMPGDFGRGQVAA